MRAGNTVAFDNQMHCLLIETAATNPNNESKTRIKSLERTYYTGQSSFSDTKGLHKFADLQLIRLLLLC